MKKRVLYLLVLILGIGGFIGYKILYKNHRDIGGEKASFSLSVKKFEQEFVINDSIANAKYADKTVEVQGKITNIDTASNSIAIDEKLEAAFKEKISGLRLQQGIKIKGRFVGYDDLLGELKMDQVSILK